MYTQLVVDRKKKKKMKKKITEAYLVDIPQAKASKVHNMRGTEDNKTNTQLQ